MRRERAGWRCKFIQNSKEPSARSVSLSSSTRGYPSDFGLSPSPGEEPTLSRRLRPSGEVARGYRNARFATKKNSQLYGRKFGTLAIRSDRPLRSRCCARGLFRGNKACDIESRIERESGRKLSARNIKGRNKRTKKCKMHR